MSVTRLFSHPFIRRTGLLAVALVCSVASAARSEVSAAETRVVQQETDVFRVRFPGGSQQTGGVGKSPAEEQHQFMLKAAGGVYMLVYQDYPNLDFAEPTVAKSALDVARDGFQEALGAQLTGERSIRFPGSGLSGREFELNIPKLNGQSRSRSVVIGHRWYSVTVLGTPEFVQSAAATQFLKSATVERTATDTQRPPRGRNARLHNIIQRLGD